MSDPYEVVRQFEAALCEYTGAKYAVATTSCTMALTIALAWWRASMDTSATGVFVRQFERDVMEAFRRLDPEMPRAYTSARSTRGAFGATVPCRTYVGVAQAVLNSGLTPVFLDLPWAGSYQIGGTAVVDSARRFTSGMFRPREMRCVSFQWTKILSIGQGGAILHDNDGADAWLRRARFDGRTEGADPKTDKVQVPGWHATMMPRDAAEGLTRLANLPLYNADLPNSDYPDLREVFG